MEFRRIESFDVDHTKLLPGMYVSRRDGDVTTYDLRLKRPNSEPVITNGALHTIEHIFATYVRNSPLRAGIIYFGPMGCRTGFYFLTRGLTDAQAVELTRQAFEFIAGYSGPVPGASPAECGNWREHDLPEARREAEKYLAVLGGVSGSDLSY
jgi:S-ribosylhomocysteine lyase